MVRRLATDAMQPATALRNQVYLFSAAIALVAALLGLLVAGRIVIPLRGIAEAAQRIGAGELGVHIPEFGGYREVATLSDSLRAMLAALRGNEARLAALNENLDQRVRQRTSEIAEAHEALARQESRLRAVIETATDGVLIVGEGNRVENFNPACEAIFGWKADEIVGRSVSELIGGDIRLRRAGPHGFDELVQSLLESGEDRGHVRTVRGRRREGEGFPLEVSLSRTVIQNVPVHIAIVRDVTEAVRAHDELFALATKDSLTSLRNRRYFLEGAETEFARARRHGRGFSLLLIDADHFKTVNDTFGHDAGDRVLQNIAEVALDSLRGFDLVGRLGGEEFAVAMPEVDLDTALAVAERLRQQIAERATETDSGSVIVTVSIGVAAISVEDSTLNQMLRRADQALYAAKDRGRNQVSVAEA
jgi:diguanylate cyclase (GGDEF)-like protein/PAS domain S-box-containing protein